MTPYEWMDRLTVFTAIPLWVVGFAITIYQVIKTKGAASAARDAAQSALIEVSRHGALVLLPILHKIESDLEQAVDSGERQLVIYHLGNWRWQAGQVHRSLDLQHSENRRIARKIQTSIAQSGDAKMLIMDDNMGIVEATRKARGAIALVTADLGALVWTRMLQVEGGDNV